MERKSIIIIGADIAGLSAGCCGQMNGYRTRNFASGMNWEQRRDDACRGFITGRREGY
jgi:hypothetical protein